MLLLSAFPSLIFTAASLKSARSLARFCAIPQRMHLTSVVRHAEQIGSAISIQPAVEKKWLAYEALNYILDARPISVKDLVYKDLLLRKVASTTMNKYARRATLWKLRTLASGTRTSTRSTKLSGELYDEYMRRLFTSISVPELLAQACLGAKLYPPTLVIIARIMFAQLSLGGHLSDAALSSYRVELDSLVYAHMNNRSALVRYIKRLQRILNS